MVSMITGPGRQEFADYLTRKQNESVMVNAAALGFTIPSTASLPSTTTSRPCTTIAPPSIFPAPAADDSSSPQQLDQHNSCWPILYGQQKHMLAPRHFNAVNSAAIDQNKQDCLILAAICLLLLIGCIALVIVHHGMCDRLHTHRLRNDLTTTDDGANKRSRRIELEAAIIAFVNRMLGRG